MPETRSLLEQSQNPELQRGYRKKGGRESLQERRVLALRRAFERNRQVLDIEFQLRTINAKALGAFLIGLDAALNTAARNFVAQQSNRAAYVEGASGGFLRIQIVEMRTGSFFSRLGIVWDKTSRHPVGSGLVVAATVAVFTATAGMTRVKLPEKEPARPPKTVEEQMLEAFRVLANSDENITVHVTYGDNHFDWHHEGKKLNPPPRLSRRRGPT